MRTRSRLTAAAALVVSTAALASPAVGRPYQDFRSADARDAARLSAKPRTAPTVPVGSTAGTVSQRVPGTEVAATSATTASAFDWGSAAVGAGAAIGLSAISLGGLAGVRHRHATINPN